MESQTPLLNQPWRCTTISELLTVSFGVSVLFLLLALARAAFLLHSPVKARFGALGTTKLALVLILATFSLRELVSALQAKTHYPIQLWAPLAATATPVALGCLLALEHRHCVQPSTLATAYLIVSGFCSVAVAERIYRMRLAERGAGLAAVADVALRLVLLLVENMNKQPLLMTPYKSLPPEETAGFISRSVYWWLKNLLITGGKRILNVADMPHLDTALKPRYRRDIVLQEWEKRGGNGSGLVLLQVMVRCLMKPFMAPLIPRVLYTVTRCCQPILIGEAIKFVSNEETKQADSGCRGGWILVAAVVIYFGITFSGSMYRNQLNRLEIMVKGSLATLIYDKALHMRYEGSDPGRVVAILSTDVEGMSGAGEMFHETWGYCIEVGIGICLLARRVGWITPVPLALIFLSSRVSRFVAQNVRARTRSWNDATQTRISALSTVLASMRSVKVMGLSDPITAYIDDLRQSEIDMSMYARWMNVVYNASANALGVFTPVITIILYAVVARARGEPLDAETAFTTVAILSLVTHPANMIMTIVPRVVAAMANVDRIQAFLLDPSRADGRLRVSTNTAIASDDSVHFDNVIIRFAKLQDPTLKNISMKMQLGSVTMCAGITGSGKSTLAKAILGELSPESGTIQVSSSRIAYCDQNAWIPTGTVKEIVCAFASDVDEAAYQLAIDICCLEYDISRLADGDSTLIGSRGVNISGGQRQRLALARLVYSRASIAVLDDPFSALDGNTETKIAERLLGPGGWFRSAGITVFITGNASQHFRLADQVILLESGTISYRGDGAGLRNRVSAMEKFNIETEGHKPEAEDVSQSAKKQADADAGKDLRRAAGDITLYTRYLTSAGIGNTILLTLCTACFGFFTNFSQYWLKWWTESGGDYTGLFIVGYVTMSFIAWAGTSVNMWTQFMLLAPRSGERLHRSLLRTVVGASLSFYSSTDVGAILNRFSQDISLVDRKLPPAFSGLVTQILKMVVQIGLLVQVQRYLLLPLPVCIVAVYFVQKVYLRTSRQLRVLELESHSALYSWLLETVEGILSVRAFGWTNSATERTLSNLELSLRPLYALECLQRWLALVLNLIVSSVAVAIIALAITWRDSMSGADVGVSLNLILVVNATLVSLVSFFTQLEVSLGAIARLRETETDTPQEKDAREDVVPPLYWPEKGHLVLSSVSGGYTVERNVLDDINLDISPGQKLVVCGRTGSGKSTLVLALLRLIESTGTVTLDHEKLARIPRRSLRNRGFITVPQEPFFLPNASLSFNLDPSGLAPDAVLRASIRKVGLWEQLCNAGETDPLAKALCALPTLSAGQKQLLAVARAIVKKHVLGQSVYQDAASPPPRPVLILDEATSSLDPKTEETIYAIVEDEFVQASHAVLIVAHRTGALRQRMRKGVDKVAWLQDGRLVKMGDYEDMELSKTEN